MTHYQVSKKLTPWTNVESFRLFKIENYELTLSEDLELPVPYKGKVKELKDLHENLIKESTDKTSKMPPKMPRHETRINREINKIETCIKNAKEAREAKYSQEVHQYKCELNIYKGHIKKYKEELSGDKNEEKMNVYDTLEEKLNDIDLKINSEIANDEYYLVEKIAKKVYT